VDDLADLDVLSFQEGPQGRFDRGCVERFDIG